jgi:hypothetical protein
MEFSMTSNVKAALNPKAALAASVLAFAGLTLAKADDIKDGRIAIVDISYSLLAEDGSPDEKTFKALHDANVLVIGRYMSRCPQHDKYGNLWRKRLIDGSTRYPDAEAKAILAENFAILSIYQYNNRGPKFAGEISGPECFKSSHENEIRLAKSPQAREGILDAEAALLQAKAIHQPKHTVIYFGVDYYFPHNPKKPDVEKAGILAYFQEIKNQFDPAEYRIGAYAGGDILKMLLGDNPDHKKLIDVAWIAPSASYPGSSDFHSHGPWALFQSEADNEKLVLDNGKCVTGVSYDTNIQNVAADDDLGFWDKNGIYKVPAQRTQAIYQQRRFICDRRNLSMPTAAKSCSGPINLNSCKPTSNGEPCFIRTVRVKPGSVGGDLAIDFHEYGTFDFTISARRVTASMKDKPLYEHAPWDSEFCPPLPKH